MRRFLESFQDSGMIAVYLHPGFWALIGAVFVLERLIPAGAKRRLLSAGLLQDAIYFGITLFVQVFVVSFYVAFLRSLYDAYLGFLTIEAAAAWPAAARAASAILADDLLGWFHHLLRHKVRPFWYFHMVHHSQRELNPFTDMRYHPVEYLVAKSITALPMFMLQNALPIVVGYLLLQQWYTKFYHANVRVNLGPLRYLLVTPQSHRIHHSIEGRHAEHNFAVTFSVWDRLFGTQWPGCDEYPECGIPDAGFPLERAAKPAALLASSWAQWTYPFRLLSGRAAAGR